MKKRLLSVFLIAALLVCAIPATVSQAFAVDANTWLWPVEASKTISSNFGMRDLNGNGKYDSFHSGIDIYCSIGSAVRAAKSGTIYDTCFDYGSEQHTSSGGMASYGNYVAIKHTDGTYSLYAHLKQQQIVKKGDTVSQGDTIAYSGNSGNSGGPHCHFQATANPNNGWSNANNLINTMPTEACIRELGLKVNNKYVEASGYSSERMTYIWSIDSSIPNSADNGKSVSIAEGTYYIEAYCGKVVEVEDSKTSNKANVQIWDKSSRDLGCQKFNITKSGDYYTLTAVHSGKAIDIADGSSKSGTNIWQYTVNGSDAQKWQFEDAGDGYYYIRSALGTYMDIYDNGTANGTNVWAYKFNGSNAQKFKLVSLSDPLPPDDTVISADDIVAVAQSLVGQYSYVSGGESPDEGGFDCTGLVYYIYHTRLGMKMTIKEARSKSGLLALGTKITNKEDLLPGDVLQMEYSTGPHVVIYIGNNQIVEAAKPGTMVRQQSFSNISSGFSYGIRFPQVKQNGSTTPLPYTLTIKYNTNGGSISSGTYSATSSGMIQKSGSDVTANWPYGYGHENGLYNASTFGLYREDYTFAGWSLSKDGTTTVFDQDDTTLKAETIYPDLINGNASVTLYAVWDRKYGPVADFWNSVSVAVNGSTVTVQWMSFPGAITYYARLGDGSGVAYESGALDGTVNAYTFRDVANGQYVAMIELVAGGLNTMAQSSYFTVNVVHTHRFVYTPAKAATCVEKGNTEYWYCAECDKYFSDADGRNEIKLADTVIPALGHAYENGICIRCGMDVSKIGFTVNDIAVAWTDVEPFIDENSRTMVPLRAVADALGLIVDWDGSARMAIFSKDSKIMFFPIGSTVAYTTEGTVTMDTAAIIVNDRTFAPIRYLAEYFGFTVSWDDATRTVRIG